MKLEIPGMGVIHDDGIVEINNKKAIKDIKDNKTPLDSKVIIKDEK